MATATATIAQDRGRGGRRLAQGARLAALLALCLLPAHGGAVRAEGRALRQALPALAVDAAGGRAQDAVPLALAALAFVVVRGWRRGRPAGFFG